MRDARAARAVRRIAGASIRRSSSACATRAASIRTLRLDGVLHVAFDEAALARLRAARDRSDGARRRERAARRARRSPRSRGSAGTYAARLLVRGRGLRSTTAGSGARSRRGLRSARRRDCERDGGVARRMRRAPRARRAHRSRLPSRRRGGQRLRRVGRRSSTGVPAPCRAAGAAGQGADARAGGAARASFAGATWVSGRAISCRETTAGCSSARRSKRPASTSA